MKRLVFLLLVVAATAVTRTAPGDTAPASLSDFFTPGVVFQDRNGDGTIDFVDVRIVVPEQPSSAELAAAADIGGRLGYETSAMNLPLAVAKGDLRRRQIAGRIGRGTRRHRRRRFESG